MTLLITAFVILLAYVFYVIKQVGVTASLSESYYKVKHKWLFQVAMGITGLLMMIVLLEMTAERYKFLAFFSTSALMFVAVAPNFKDKLADKVHAISALISAVASVLLVSLLGFWYVPVALLSLALLISLMFKNWIFWLEMACFVSVFVSIWLS